MPLIVIAFNVDRIAELISKLRDWDKQSWQKLTTAGTVLCICAAVFTPIWTSQLSISAKVAATVALLVVGLGAVVAGILYSASSSALGQKAGTDTSNTTNHSSSSGKIRTSSSGLEFRMTTTRG